MSFLVSTKRLQGQELSNVGLCVPITFSIALKWRLFSEFHRQPWKKGGRRREGGRRRREWWERKNNAKNLHVYGRAKMPSLGKRHE